MWRINVFISVINHVNRNMTNCRQSIHSLLHALIITSSEKLFYNKNNNNNKIANIYVVTGGPKSE